jgi:hemerythrin-like domain-containing protein
MATSPSSRRSFLNAAAVGSGVLLAGTGCGSGEKAGTSSGAPEVSPTEDLMREHGLLNRLLLVYDESTRRLESSAALDLRWVRDAAGLIKRFIEEYHERLEEDHLFPRFLKAGTQTELVAVLRAQHDAGRCLTAEILELAKPGAALSPDVGKKLSTDLRLFVRMYRPHEAREDTVLFPALRELLSARELDALGEDFEKKEHELFGKEGFKGMVERAVEIEKAMGVYDLGQFTP